MCSNSNVCKSYNFCTSHHLAPCMHLHPIWYPRTGNTSVEVVRKQKRYQSTRKQQASFSTVGILVVFSFAITFTALFFGSQRFLLGKKLCFRDFRRRRYWMTLKRRSVICWRWVSWLQFYVFYGGSFKMHRSVVCKRCYWTPFLSIQRIRERDNFWWKQPLGRLCMVVSFSGFFWDLFQGILPRS